MPATASQPPAAAPKWQHAPDGVDPIDMMNHGNMREAGVFLTQIPDCGTDAYTIMFECARAGACCAACERNPRNAAQAERAAPRRRKLRTAAGK